ncbi:MAG: MerR family transcriptional regulator [Candidatus Bruticola sp.]
MVNRISDGKQIKLLSAAPMYLSQGEAAAFMRVSVRNLQYWESLGLLHREIKQNKRSCRYTRLDLVEINFIRSLIYEHGFAASSLKEKLVQLKSPYYYDPDEIFWDNKNRCWCSRSDIACQELNKSKRIFASYVRQIVENKSDSSDFEIAFETISILRAIIRGQRFKNSCSSKDKT